MDRSKDKLRKGKPAAYCPWLPEFSGSCGGDSPNFQTRSPSCLFSGAFLWIQIIPNTPANPGPAPKTSIPECLGLGWGLGLGLGVGVRVGPRLGSVAGLEMEVEQQTMGQGWLKHRSKARRAGPEAELVTSSREGCVPGGPVAIEDCRSCVVPKLWLDPSASTRSSSERRLSTYSVDMDTTLGATEKGHCLNASHHPTSFLYDRLCGLPR